MNEMYDVIPSEEGLALILALLPDSDRYLRIARTGAHHLNPYHNLNHELATCYWAYSCYVNSINGDEETLPIEFAHEIKRLLMAALFHDHGHSGGRESDVSNVDRSANFVLNMTGFDGMKAQFGSEWVEIVQAINCTVFIDGEFPVAPKTFVAKCLRDADLMSIYSAEGRRLLLGLIKELGWPLLNSTDVTTIVERQAKFLNDAHMYTDFGRLMQAYHLKDALAAFSELLHLQLPDQLRQSRAGSTLM